MRTLTQMGSLCPRCSTETPVGAATCSSCGEDLLDLSRTPTGTAPRPRSATPSAGAASQTALPKTRFAPGTLLADRYRVISLVGKGGMGEVYRVDDIRLGQSVALKFLPPGLQADPERLERLYGEVRVARQISHPNVCRVYDVGEVEGQPFLSMEYVDGEDLASLLRRIGRLPSHKAIEISQQLCAGLTAAHERNVLHRDLKPENI
ncbi:MAG TPA: serine/threonine-protein kinase, partial [Vicinamibacteria bacterium]|nr:serine/threonine-protein kinase [Vicinamibacteria bacterium]